VQDFLDIHANADRQTGGWMDEWMDVPTLHIVSYFAGTDAFMSLHKPIITLTLQLTPLMSLPTVFMQNISP